MKEQFKKQLEDLINANCIDTLCDKPDYELAEMVCDFLSKLVKKEKEKEKSEGVVIGGEDHKNYIDFEEYLKLQKEKEELEKEVERLQKVLYTVTGSLDDGEPDLYEDC